MRASQGRDRPLKVGIIGFGAIGREVLRILRSERCEPAAVLVREAREDMPGIRFVHALADFLAADHDVIVECAGQTALRDCAVAVLSAGIDLVPASMGVLADDAFRGAVARASAQGRGPVRIPGGAMAGIDGLVAARAIGIDRVLYRGTMPAGSLKRVGSGELPAAVHALVFAGTAREAVSRFPKNANLAATIALAGVGFDRTRVELFVDPVATHNIHELEAEGVFGQLHVTVSGPRICEASASSRIVPGSLAHAALGSTYSLLPGEQ